jgi:hypothetical protein
MPWSVIVELYLDSPTRRHGVVLNWLNIRTTLPGLLPVTRILHVSEIWTAFGNDGVKLMSTRYWEIYFSLTDFIPKITFLLFSCCGAVQLEHWLLLFPFIKANDCNHNNLHTIFNITAQRTRTHAMPQARFEPAVLAFQWRQHRSTSDRTATRIAAKNISALL